MATKKAIKRTGCSLKTTHRLGLGPLHIS